MGRLGPEGKAEYGDGLPICPEAVNRIDAYLMIKLKGRRRNSRLPKLGELLLRRSYVSRDMAARALKASPEAVRLMFTQLGGVVRERTGQSSYRLWSV